MKQYLSMNTFFLATGFILLAIQTPFPVFAVIGFALIFTAFDVVGYQPDDLKDVFPYRTLQLIFEAVLLLSLLHRFGLQAVLAAGVLHLFLVCDVLFFLIKGIPVKSFSWFKASPFVALSMYVFKRALPVWGVWMSAVVGIVLAGWILL